MQLVADCHLDELTSRDFEAMVVPGGLPGSEVIRDTPRHRPAERTGPARPLACGHLRRPAVVLHHHGLLGMPASPAIPAFRPACLRRS